MVILYNFSKTFKSFVEQLVEKSHSPLNLDLGDSPVHLNSALLQYICRRIGIINIFLLS